MGCKGGVDLFILEVGEMCKVGVVWRGFLKCLKAKHQQCFFAMVC